MAGDYKFNVTGTFPDPTEAGWIDRNEKGVSGDGHSIYPLARKFELRWNLLSMEEFQTIVGFYNLVQSTGSFIADLPRYAQPWAFTSYTGCVMKEPSTGKFFETYVQDVSLLIVNIITG